MGPELELGFFMCNQTTFSPKSSLVVPIKKEHKEKQKKTKNKKLELKLRFHFELELEFRFFMYQDHVLATTRRNQKTTQA
jgi:hypothetical protein